MNDIPFYDPNKDGLFDRANRRNHTELFVIVQIPDHFTFIIDFEYLGAVGLYGILVMSLPVADVQAAILCRKQAGDEEQAGAFDIVLTITAGYFAVVEVHFHQGVTVTTGNPMVPVSQCQCREGCSFETGDLHDFASRRDLAHVGSGKEGHQVVTAGILVQLAELGMRMFDACLIFGTRQDFSLRAHLHDDSRMAYPTQKIVTVGQHAGSLHLTGIGSGNIPDLLMVAVDQLRTSGIGKEDIPVGSGNSGVAFPAFFEGMLPLYLLGVLIDDHDLVPAGTAQQQFFCLLLAGCSGYQQQCGTEISK